LYSEPIGVSRGFLLLGGGSLVSITVSGITTGDCPILLDAVDVLENLQTYFLGACRRHRFRGRSIVGYSFERLIERSLCRCSMVCRSYAGWWMEMAKQGNRGLIRVARLSHLAPAPTYLIGSRPVVLQLRGCSALAAGVYDCHHPPIFLHSPLSRPIFHFYLSHTSLSSLYSAVNNSSKKKKKDLRPSNETPQIQTTQCHHHQTFSKP